MNDLNKHANTYKSVIGQLDRLIQDSEDEEAKEHLIEAKASVEVAFHIEITGVFAELRRAMRNISKGLSMAFGNLARSFSDDDVEDE